MSLPPSPLPSNEPSPGPSSPAQPVGAWIGLDWASRCHVWELHNHSGDIATGQVANDPQSVLAWIESLDKLIPQGAIRILLETKTAPIAHWLAAHPRLEVYVIHPGSLNHYRSAQRASGAKDDASDAALLNEYLRKHPGRLERLRPSGGDYPGLAKLAATRRSLVDARSGLVAQLRAELALSLPQCLDWFANLTSSAAAKFLARWPSLEALAKAPAGLLSRMLREDFRWDREKIQLWRKQLKQTQPPIANHSLLQASALHVQALARQLECLAASLALFDKQIEALASRQQDYPLFASLPGAGKALAPRLMVAFGQDRQAWDSARSLQCYSGVAPITRASGRSHVVAARFACPKFHRQSFVEFARCSVGHSVWAAEYFQQQSAKGVGRQAIFRSLAFKWIRILFRCWTDRTPYDEQRYLAERQAKLLKRSAPPAHPHKKASDPVVDFRWKSCGDFKKFSLD